MPKKASSIKLINKIQSENSSINSDRMLEQFREAKRIATIKNEAQFKIDDMNNRF